MSRPLLVTADPALTAEVQRIAATIGVDIDTADSPAAAAASWASAPIVLVGVDLAIEVARTDKPWRGDVVLIGMDADDAASYEKSALLRPALLAFLPDGTQWLIDALNGTYEPPAGRARTVAVLGARGGAGATSFAVALALAGVRAGHRTALVDCDPLGGGIDLALCGAELPWPKRVLSAAQPADELAAGLSRDASDRLTVVTCARIGSYVVSAQSTTGVVRSLERATDLIVLDVDRSFGGSAQAALWSADTTYLICPAEVRAVAAGRRVAEAASLLTSDLRVIVRGQVRGDLDPAAVAETFGFPLAGVLDDEPLLAADLDLGVPPGRDATSPLAQLCDALLA